MKQRVLCFLLSLALASPSRAVAQTEAADLAQGIRQVDEGDLAAAVITLDGVVRKLTGASGRTSELAQAHLYLGIAHLGLNQGERARAEMKAAWTNNKGMKLDPKKFSPRVIQAFEEAKTEASSAPKPAATSAAAPPPAAGEAASEKKGGSKALLIVGGLAVAGGAVALAGGGGGTDPVVAPTPAPPAGPQTLVQGTWQLVGSGSAQNFPFTVPAAGSVIITVDWTLPSDDVDVYLFGPTGATVGTADSSTNKPERISANVTAGSYTAQVYFYGLTNGDLTSTGRESGVISVLFTRQ